MEMLLFEQALTQIHLDHLLLCKLNTYAPIHFLD